MFFRVLTGIWTKKIESNFTATLEHLTKTLTMKKFFIFPRHKNSTRKVIMQLFPVNNNDFNFSCLVKITVYN